MSNDPKTGGPSQDEMNKAKLAPGAQPAKTTDNAHPKTDEKAAPAHPAAAKA